jgi:POT family proton-dependent oligopeptide transporter
MTEVAASAGTAERHPPGIAILSATELAERFSYYGMTALLALYMTKQLLLPGHAEHVVGLSTLRSAFEFRGAMSNTAFASLIYGWYGGLVYFTPLAGGWLADRVLGAKRTVILGALLMTGGHLAMAFDQSFLLALLLLICGSGCLKGNLAAQVGSLYPRDAESMRERGFTLFSTAINIGSVAGPLATGGLAASRGFHAGFTLAAGLMLVALLVYLGGQRLLPEPPLRRADRPVAAPLTAAEKRRTGAILAVIALNIPTAICYPMIWNIGILWIDEKVSLASPFGAVPASWFNSVDSFASIVVVPPLVALWAWQSRRGVEPSSLTKLAIGFAITGASALFFTAGVMLPGSDGKISVLWPLAGFFGMGVGFMYYWPVSLALVSKAAPAKLAATLMSSVYLALFVGTVVMGWVGSFYDQMSGAAFWTLDGAISLAGAVLTLALRRPLEQALAVA